MHTTVLGRTLSGKTTFLKRQIQFYKSQGINTLVLDSLNDPNWGADFVTNDADYFIKVAKMNRKCILVIDEAGDSVGHYDKSRFWLATQARHWGHSSFFASQRLKMIAPTVRTQTSALVLFKCALSEARELADEFAEDKIKLACKFRKGQYIYVPPFSDAKIYQLF